MFVHIYIPQIYIHIALLISINISLIYLYAVRDNDLTITTIVFIQIKSFLTKIKVICISSKLSQLVCRYAYNKWTQQQRYNDFSSNQSTLLNHSLSYSIIIIIIVVWLWSASVVGFFFFAYPSFGVTNDTAIYQYK